MERRFDYHPNCQNMSLNHLSFADDIMVFTVGKTRSLDSIVEVFDHFFKIAWLKISLEKSKIYCGGVSEMLRKK